MATGTRRSARSLRKALHSPGRPPVARREHWQVFWSAVAAGRSSEDAAGDAGVSPPVGARWFREAGGMPPSHLAPWAKPPSGRYLSFVEREEIALLRAGGRGAREIAERLERAPSTISRELRERRGHARRWPGVSGDDRAMARGSVRSSSEAGEDGGERKAARLCAGSSRRPDRRAGRQGPLRAERGVDGPPGRTPAGPAMGKGLEPGADREPAQARLP